MYKYEMHQHTAACSLCAEADTKELIKALHDAGFQGVVLTNHFYHGNTAIKRDIPWERFCEAYKTDYEIAKKEAKKYKMDVIFGIEEGIGNGKEVLIYGLTPKQIIKHHELRNGGLENISAVVHKEGGLVFQAHPFRVRDYIKEPYEKVPLKYLDGFESINRGNRPESNQMAIEYAEKNNLPQIAGSDSHSLDINIPRFGIICNRRIKNGKQLVRVLKSGKYKIYIENIDDFENNPCIPD